MPQSACFDSATSFGLIRGGHIDQVVLGAMEIAEIGDISNWMIPGKKVRGMGRAMYFVAGVRKVIVVMERNATNGGPRFMPACILPLTGKKVVDMVVTDIAVFQSPGHESPIKVIGRAPGETADDEAVKTAAD